MILREIGSLGELFFCPFIIIIIIIIIIIFNTYITQINM